MIRYADDFVIGFEHEADARACLEALGERLGQFGLNLHPKKTRLIEFGRGSAARRERKVEASVRRLTFWASRMCAGRRGGPSDSPCSG